MAAGPEKRVMTVGIWVHETDPAGFLTEGISRLLALLVRSAQNKQGIRIKLACVPWVQPAIVSYMEDLGVDAGRLEFITTDKRPTAIYELGRWWQSRPRTTHKPLRRGSNPVTTWVRSFAWQLVTLAVSQRGWLGWVWFAFSSLALAPLLPCYCAYHLVRRLVRRLAASSRFARLCDGVGRRFAAFGKPLRSAGRAVWHKMVDRELDRLASLIAGDGDVDVWFFPYPKQPHLHRLKAAKVVAVPDLVYRDFPTLFARSEDFSDLESLVRSVAQTIREADAVVTYSTYVKDAQLVAGGFHQPGQIHVVRHAPHDLSHLVASADGASREQLRLRAGSLIREYIQELTAGCDDRASTYLQALPFGEIDYLFVSSQTRAHKNHLNLLKAYRTLLRERFRNVKLILTGGFTAEMQQWIDQERLHLDVLSIRRLPPRVHAAFFVCAKLVVCPTLFEGGFPFVFSEAVSCGTPAVLSDIAVVRELLSAASRSLICFDPYDIQDMVERMEWALEHADELFAHERALYGAMRERTWDDVADDYIQVFQSAWRRHDDPAARRIDSADRRPQQAPPTIGDFSPHGGSLPGCERAA